MAQSGSVITDLIASRPSVEAVTHQARHDAVISEHAAITERKASIVSADVEAVDNRKDSITAYNEQFPPPTEEEAATLRRTYGNIPWIAWTLCFVEFAERASYYGVANIYGNYMRRPLPPGGNGAGAPPRGSELQAGAMGRGAQFSSAFVLLNKFLGYTTPIFGAWIADAKIGKYKAIWAGVLICGVAHIIMVISAIPSILQAGNEAGPFLLSVLLLAFGAGLFKPAILPLLLEQYPHQRDYVTTLKSGERVIIDIEKTISHVTLLFYAFVNIGGFFSIATTYSEKYIGWWLAFLLPGIIYFLLPLLLVATHKRIKKTPPKGSELTDVARIFGMAIKKSKGAVWRKGFWDAAKPSVLAREGIEVRWNDHLVEDIRRTVVACGMFLWYPVWYINKDGLGDVPNAQGASMTTKGAPNDLMNNFNPLTIVVTVPVLSYLIYPALDRWKMTPPRVNRIVFGFILATIGGIAGAIVQDRVYKTSPCGNHATTCDGVSPISIWWQLPNTMLGAISECFAQTTGYELAYSRSPRNMKALVMSFFLFTYALAAALAEIITPAIEDPNLTWIWAGPAIVLFVIAIVFYFKYRWMNTDAYMTYEEEQERLIARNNNSDEKQALETADSGEKRE